MDWLQQLFAQHHWKAWDIVGWAGTAIFGSRFVVQWYATEKLGRVSVPASFWWLSLAGTLAMLCYAIFGLHKWVIIVSYALNWIPYGRNLIIHYRHEREQSVCSDCGLLSPPSANYCAKCGARLTVEPAAKAKA